jgi:lysophospholipase L1-like esterase
MRRGVLALVAIVVVAVAVTAVLVVRGTAGESANYVALGSSFAAGPGIPDQIPGTEDGCRRSTNNYPHQVAGWFRLTLTDATCSGATTDNILTSGQYGQPAQIQSVTTDTNLVTITIGGNDVSYLGSLVALSCRNDPTVIPPQERERRCAPVNGSTIEQGTLTVENKIVNVVKAVRERAPQAQVVLVNYVTILPPTGTTTCDDVPLTADEVTWARLLAENLVGATARAAELTGATLVDAATASADHHACAAEPWVLRFTPQAAYHPNMAGMTAVGDLVIEAVRNGRIVEVGDAS